MQTEYKPINLATGQEERLGFLSLVFPYLNSNEIGKSYSVVPLDSVFANGATARSEECKNYNSFRDFNTGRRIGTQDEPGNYVGKEDIHCSSCLLSQREGRACHAAKAAEGF